MVLGPGSCSLLWIRYLNRSKGLVRFNQEQHYAIIVIHCTLDVNNSSDTNAAAADDDDYDDDDDDDDIKPSIPTWVVRMIY